MKYLTDRQRDALDKAAKIATSKLFFCDVTDNGVKRYDAVMRGAKNPTWRGGLSNAYGAFSSDAIRRAMEANKDCIVREVLRHVYNI